MDTTIKRALVTGASKGIGHAISQTLVAAGWHVTGVARGQHALGSVHIELGELFEPWCVDATSDALLERIASAEPFDLLVNNLGTARHAPLVDTPDTDLDLVLDTNIRATLRITRAVTRVMRAGASVVTITSQMAHVGGPDRIVYCTTKAALEGMTRALAVELAPRGIRANSVAPTFVRTPLTAPMLDEPEFARWVEDMIPLGRVAQAGDVAEAVAYLADARSVTGHSLRVDGGWTAR